MTGSRISLGFIPFVMLGEYTFLLPESSPRPLSILSHP